MSQAYKVVHSKVIQQKSLEQDGEGGQSFKEKGLKLTKTRKDIKKK